MQGRDGPLKGGDIFFAKTTPIFLLPLTAAAIWFLRLFNEGAAGYNVLLEEFWLPVFRPLMLIAVGVFWASLFLKAFEANTRRKFWLWAYLAAAVFCLPYAPDMYASFVKAGEKRAVLLSVAFYALGILTYGLIRGGSCIFWSRRILCRISNPHLRSGGLYFIFLVTEFLFFHTWHPITYFPALPLPLPSSSFSTEGRGAAQVGSVFFETHVDGETRARIAQGGGLALSLLGSKLAEQTEAQLKSVLLGKDLTVILPETFVTLENVSDAGALGLPVAAALFKNTFVESVVWVQGAFVANNNVILGMEIRRNELQEKAAGKSGIPVFVLRKKNEQMPMFEAPSKGVSYSSIINDGSLVEQKVPADFPGLKAFVDSHRLMICYESLFPSNWKFGYPSVILTNHHLFNEFRLMNWVYFGFLRQMSFIFRSPAKIVSNFNPSGLLSPFNSGVSGSSGKPEGWAVVRFE